MRTVQHTCTCTCMRMHKGLRMHACTCIMRMHAMHDASDLYIAEIYDSKLREQKTVNRQIINIVQ